MEIRFLNTCMDEDYSRYHYVTAVINRFAVNRDFIMVLDQKKKQPLFLNNDEIMMAITVRYTKISPSQNTAKITAVISK